jgi:thiol-disulfide isomerase/thioredoxin
MMLTTRTVFRGLIAVIVAAGLAAIYLLWEQSGGGDDAPLGGVDKFVAREDGTPAPAISFQDGERHRLTLADFRGQVVLVNIWATWCVPCVRELPSLDRLQAKVKPLGVKIVALSIDRGGAEAVRQFFAENGIHNLDVYVDPTMAAQAAFEIPGLPTSILIDRNGHDRGRLVGGADWDGEKAADLVLSVKAGP